MTFRARLACAAFLVGAVVAQCPSGVVFDFEDVSTTPISINNFVASDGAAFTVDSFRPNGLPNNVNLCDADNSARECFSASPHDKPFPTIHFSGDATPANRWSLGNNNGVQTKLFVITFTANQPQASDFSLLVYDHAADGGSKVGDDAVLRVYNNANVLLASDVLTVVNSMPDAAVIRLAASWATVQPIARVELEFESGDNGLAIDYFTWGCNSVPTAPVDTCTIAPLPCADELAEECFTLTNIHSTELTFTSTVREEDASGSAVGTIPGAQQVTVAAGGSAEVCFSRGPANEANFVEMSAQANGVNSPQCKNSQPSCAAVPPCTLPESEWLVTQFEPHLVVPNTGFVTGVKDMFRWSWDNHRKYMNTYFTVTNGEFDALEAEAVVEHTTLTNQPDPGCWDTWTLDIEWGDMVPYCARDDISDSAFVIYTCKLAIDGNESLDPIRSVALSRIVHNELVVQVLFPKQVTATVADLSAFQPPNVLAAIVRQEVNVDVSDLGVVAYANIFTSVQYPFRLINAEWDSANQAGASPQPNGINGGAVASVSDCDPYPAAGDQPGQPGDENACNQVFRFNLDVIGGANPGQSVCQLDGDYYIQFQAVCLPTFPSDCPLVKDDLGETSDSFEVKFTLDSEYFCPQVVDEVDVSASIAVYKDIDHSVAATNFILGQTLYLVASVSSSKVTVAGVQLDDMSFNRGSGAQVAVSDKVDNALLDALVWYDSGAVVAGATVPDNEIWAQFLVTSPAFSPAVDGSEDFSVSITMDVQFKDAAVMLLAADRQLGATAVSSFSADADTAVTDSAATVSAAAAVGAAVAAIAL